MDKHALSIKVVLIILLIGSTCTANTNLADNCDINKDNNTQQKETISKQDDLVSSVLKVPGNIIDGMSNIPLDDIVSSTLEIPTNTVKFVAEIPYDEIVWSTLEVSAEVAKIILEDDFLFGFLVGYYCGCN